MYFYYTVCIFKHLFYYPPILVSVFLSVSTPDRYLTFYCIKLFGFEDEEKFGIVSLNVKLINFADH